jgi:hypothetical protein
MGLAGTILLNPAKNTAEPKHRYVIVRLKEYTLDPHMETAE